MLNYKFMNEWLSSHDLTIEKSFTERLRDYANAYKKNGTNLSEIYLMLGCSKQNLSYWQNHFFSSQFQNSVLKVILNAWKLFDLSQTEKESLANSAGFSFRESEFTLDEALSQYKGKLKTLYDSSLITERMFRYYRTNFHPPKQALLSLSVILNLSPDEIKKLLNHYGYCLSDSLINDAVVLWSLTSGATEANRNNRQILLLEINETLHSMGLPILGTNNHEKADPHYSKNAGGKGKTVR